MEEVARVLGPIEVEGKCTGRRWRGLTGIWPGAWLVSSCEGWLQKMSDMRPKGSWVPVERALNVPLKSLNFILRAEASTCRIDSRRDPWGKGGCGKAAGSSVGEAKEENVHEDTLQLSHKPGG